MFSLMHLLLLLFATLMSVPPTVLGYAHSIVTELLAEHSPPLPSPSPSLQWLQEDPLKETSLVRHLFGARGTDRLYSKDFFRCGD